MELVSVIIPVYKVEKYLNQCIESVVNQTYQNLEIILVDDGSPDNCPKMCDEWAKKDSRIKVIHKENGGVSSARNMALEVFKGDYLCFLDSDDTIHPNYIEVLHNAIKENNADVSVCNWKKVYDINNPQNKKLNSEKLSYKVFNNSNIFDLLYNKQIPLVMALWLKMYAREIFKDIRFPDVVVSEDDAIIHKVLFNCKRLVYVDCVLYNNTQRNSSLTATDFSMKKLKSLYIFKDRIMFIEENKPEFKTKAIMHYIKILILYYYKSKWAKFDKGILKKIKAEINFYAKQGYVSKYVFMFKYLPHIFESLIKIKLKRI